MGLGIAGREEAVAAPAAPAVAVTAVPRFAPASMGIFFNEAGTAKVFVPRPDSAIKSARDRFHCIESDTLNFAGNGSDARNRVCPEPDGRSSGQNGSRRALSSIHH